MAKRWNIILPIVVVIIVGVIVFIKRDDLGSFVETIKDVSIVPFALAACLLFGRLLQPRLRLQGGVSLR